MAKKPKPKDKTKLKKTKEAKEHPPQVEKTYPKQTILCIGDYTTRIITQNSHLDKKIDSHILFIDKFSKNLAGSKLNPDNILPLDLNHDTHFWYQALPHLKENNILIENMKNRPIDNTKGVVILSSLWDGFSSAINPVLISHFKQSNTNSMTVGILPSQLQPPDAHFNAYSSIGLSLSKDFTSMLLLDRDQIENFVGINRNGLSIKGTEIVNYILDLIIEKETFVKELAELTRTFNVRTYSVLLASGASLSVYGSLENILNTALLQPLLKFDLSTSSLLYVVARIPAKLKKILTKSKIELTLADWFKEKANLKSIQISEPIYVEGEGNRIDIALFIGGFNLSSILTSIQKKANPIKNQILKQGSIKKKEWEEIAKSINVHQ
jgi:hypothetical protein